MNSFGIWGIVPPLLTIILAFVTKDVIVALFVGIFTGSLIVAGGNVFHALLALTDLIADMVSDGWNIRIFLFCALLGGLVGMLSRTGAAHAFGLWAAKKVKNPRTTLLMAWFCGLIIFIDDYFNALAVGTVMRPIIDKNKVPRAKLAYVLDSTAAPVCIIVPVSSWVITVMSIVKGSEGFSALGVSEFTFFIRSIPYNIYALLTLLMVVVLIITGRDYGPMKKSAELAKQGKLYNSAYGEAPGEMEREDLLMRPNAKAIDMLLPILVLIVSAVIMFPVTTYLSLIDGETATNLIEASKLMSVPDAFNNTDASMALWYAAVFTIAVTYIYFLARRLMNISQASSALTNGIKSMVPALIILSMAWVIGAIIKSSPEDGGLGLSAYLSELVIGGGFPLFLVPIIVYALSALIAFSTGSSWGTFAIMIPITMPIAVGLAQSAGYAGAELMNTALFCTGAVLGGAVFGDHTSPISDTTILSSTGAGCPHLEHVATQLPYSTTAAVCGGLGMLAGSMTMSLAVTWAVALVLFVLAIIVLPKILKG